MQSLVVQLAQDCRTLICHDPSYTSLFLFKNKPYCCSIKNRKSRDLPTLCSTSFPFRQNRWVFEIVFNGKAQSVSGEGRENDLLLRICYGKIMSYRKSTGYIMRIVLRSHFLFLVPVIRSLSTDQISLLQNP